MLKRRARRALRKSSRTAGPVSKKPQLRSNMIYLAGDRMVCFRIECAGPSLLYTRITPTGERAERLPASVVQDWDVANNGPLRCECGALEAQPLHGGTFALFKTNR